MSEVSESQKLQVLHEHYQETFADLREREKYRDRLFLQVVGVVGILLLMVQNPDIATDLFKTFNLQATINLAILPYHILVSIIWTLLLVLVVRFNQTSNTIDNTYQYLSHLEDQIQSYFYGAFIYKREGKFYRANVSKFRDFIRIFYSKIIPGIILLSTGTAIVLEWVTKKNNIFYSLYDTAILIVIFLAVILYRFWRQYE